jgi:putative radical SAM enzyme (TIGR03279 family)
VYAKIKSEHLSLWKGVMGYRLHKIAQVEPGSPAQKAGVTNEHLLVSVNGKSVDDAIDYAFGTAGETVSFAFKGPDGKLIDVQTEHFGAPQLGVVYESSLMDKPRACRNKCIFCFIDQLPRGMRPPLYLKDDDWRLSTLSGNYISMTNLTGQDMARIRKYKVSPLYISAHATRRDVRKRMMGNARAANILQQLKMLAIAGIHFHLQIVLVPGFNDGEIFKETLEELFALRPYAESLAVVPVGLTKYREGLCSLRLMTREEMTEAIDTVHQWQRKSMINQDTAWIFAADEMYLACGREMPEYEDYENFPQLENGIGMWRKLEREFYLALMEMHGKKSSRQISLCTGTLISGKMAGLMKDLGQETGVLVHLYPVVNTFFGEGVTVSGLLTGGDIVRALKDKPLGETLLIPRSMLKDGETVFLDGMQLVEAERMLKTNITPVEVDGRALARAALGEVEESHGETPGGHTGKA